MTFDPLNVMWTEKYRPKKVGDVVGEFKHKVAKYLESPNTMPHLLFYSIDPGTGKTTLAKAIINELEADHIVINSSDDRKIENVRETVKGFASTKSSKEGKRRIIMLDEVDGAGTVAQEALRNIMETYAKNALFILTCNNINKVHPAIVSRTVTVEFNKPSKEEVFKYLEMICEKEDIDHTDDGLNALIDVNYPSIRNCVLKLQDMKTEGLPVVKENIHRFNEEYDKIWTDVINNKDYKSLKNYIFTAGVDCRELNLYFWNKAWKEDNTKIIQVTASNEKAMSQGADPMVVFATSVIEICK